MASSTACAQGASEESFKEQRRLYNSTMCSVTEEEEKMMREGEKERKVSRLRKFNWYEKKYRSRVGWALSPMLLALV